MAAAILAFSGKYASCLVCLRLPAFKVLNLNLNLSLNLPQFAEWQHIQVKPHVKLCNIWGQNRGTLERGAPVDQRNGIDLEQNLSAQLIW